MYVYMAVLCCVCERERECERVSEWVSVEERKRLNDFPPPLSLCRIKHKRSKMDLPHVSLPHDWTIILLSVYTTVSLWSRWPVVGWSRLKQNVYWMQFTVSCIIILYYFADSAGWRRLGFMCDLYKIAVYGQTYALIPTRWPPSSSSFGPSPTY